MFAKPITLVKLHIITKDYEILLFKNCFIFNSDSIMFIVLLDLFKKIKIFLTKKNHLFLSRKPKMAVPTRTIVLPKAIACSKSEVIPILNWISFSGLPNR